MDNATWEIGERAVRALKDQYLYNGNETKDKLRNSYIEKALPGRTELIDELLKHSYRRKLPYAALEEIADYHAANDDDKEIPEKLVTWLCSVVSKRATKPIHEPEYMREITQRHRLIIHSMIVLVDFEGWKERQAVILTSEIVSRSPEAVYKVWRMQSSARKIQTYRDTWAFSNSMRVTGRKGCIRHGKKKAIRCTWQVLNSYFPSK